MLDTLIVYGSCQANAVTHALQRIGSFALQFDVVYQSDVGPMELTTEQLSRCRYFFEQRRSPFPHSDRLPTDCRRISFPYLRLGALWPLDNVVNPFDGTRFPYGNRFIISCIEQGRTKAEILAAHAAAEWPDAWLRFDDLLVADRIDFLEDDGACDVKVASYTLDNFRRERLFFTINHPSNRLIGELVAGVIHAAFRPSEHVTSRQAEEALRSFGTRDLLGNIEIPIHPRIAEHFELSWLSNDQAYNFFDEGKLSHDEYFSRMIDDVHESIARVRGSGDRSDGCVHL